MYKRLPKKVEERISQIEFANDLIDDCIGLVYLNENWQFEDGSRVNVFGNKKELIEEVMNAEPAENYTLRPAESEKVGDYLYFFRTHIIHCSSDDVKVLCYKDKPLLLIDGEFRIYYYNGEEIRDIPYGKYELINDTLYVNDKYIEDVM